MVDLSAQFKQAEFGELVGIAQPTVSDLLARGVLKAGAPGGEWLKQYCRHLREIAAGRAPVRNVGFTAWVSVKAAQHAAMDR